MNNAQLLNEEEVIVDTTVILRERKTELLRMIEAINQLAKLDSWQIVKQTIFDGQVEKLEKSLQTEVKANELNAPQIYRLQGKLEWAKRYSDLYKLAEVYKVELNQINKKLTKENDENGNL